MFYFKIPQFNQKHINHKLSLRFFMNVKIIIIFYLQIYTRKKIRKIYL